MCISKGTQSERKSCWSNDPLLINYSNFIMKSNA
uniref:Uncharacterized protein n=1 Tax=Anguilla anguilla TaxID=7936 RepID=A0A0E9VKX7_ANGAN